MDFETVRERTAGIPHMTPSQGRRIYDHLRAAGARKALEIGTACGVGTAYIAAAGAKVVSFDHANAAYTPAPEETLSRVGLLDEVTLIRRDDSSYNWWLREEVQSHARYDFCFLDGSHNFTIDGLAVILIEKLLADGGWLLLDDLDWTYPSSVGTYDPRSPHSVVQTLSQRELADPHVRSVFDVIVRNHPSFTEVIEDDNWGWARKNPGATPSYSVRPVPLVRRLKRRVMPRRWGSGESTRK